MAEPLKMVYEKECPRSTPPERQDGGGAGVRITGTRSLAQPAREPAVKVIVANRKDSANGRLGHRARVRSRSSVDDAVKAGRGGTSSS